MASRRILSSSGASATVLEKIQPVAGCDRLDLDTGLQRLGYTHFRPGQREAIETAARRSGACSSSPRPAPARVSVYQLPAGLMFSGVHPGRLAAHPALMKDQIDFLVGRGIAAARGSIRRSVQPRAPARRTRQLRDRQTEASPVRGARTTRERALPVAPCARLGDLFDAGGRRSPLHQRVGPQFSAGLHQLDTAPHGLSASRVLASPPPRRRSSATRSSPGSASQSTHPRIVQSYALPNLALPRPRGGWAAEAALGTSTPLWPRRSVRPRAAAEGPSSCTQRPSENEAEGARLRGTRMGGRRLSRGARGRAARRPPAGVGRRTGRGRRRRRCLRRGHRRP